jgi:hypothetical protein
MWLISVVARHGHRLSELSLESPRNLKGLKRGLIVAHWGRAERGAGATGSDSLVCISLQELDSLSAFCSRW